MNFRVVDEHGRQLGESRRPRRAEGGARRAGAIRVPGACGAAFADAVGGCRRRSRQPDGDAADDGAALDGAAADARAIIEGRRFGASRPPARAYTAWTFGELPELMELTQGRADAGRLSRPDRQRRARRDRGLRRSARSPPRPSRRPAAARRAAAARLAASLEKNVPDLQKTAMAVPAARQRRRAARADLDVALDRAFLAEPLPTDAAGFAGGRRRPRAGGADRQRGRAAGRRRPGRVPRGVRKLKARPRQGRRRRRQASSSQRLVAKRFIADTPWERLQHLPRYLKAIAARLDKLRADPARDSDAPRRAARRSSSAT